MSNQESQYGKSRSLKLPVVTFGGYCNRDKLAGVVAPSRHIHPSCPVLIEPRLRADGGPAHCGNFGEDLEQDGRGYKRCAKCKSADLVPEEDQ